MRRRKINKDLMTTAESSPRGRDDNDADAVASPAPSRETSAPQPIFATVDVVADFADQFTRLESENVQLRKAVKTSADQVLEANRLAAEAQRKNICLKDELKKLKKKMKDEQEARHKAFVEADEKEGSLRESIGNLLCTADMPVDRTNKLRVDSMSDALIFATESSKQIQDLLAKTKGALSRLFSIMFPKLDQNKTLGEMADIFFIDSLEAIESASTSTRRIRRPANPPVGGCLAWSSARCSLQIPCQPPASTTPAGEPQPAPPRVRTVLRAPIPPPTAPIRSAVMPQLLRSLRGGLIPGGELVSWLGTGGDDDLKKGRSGEHVGMRLTLVPWDTVRKCAITTRSLYAADALHCSWTLLSSLGTGVAKGLEEVLLCDVGPDLLSLETWALTD
ncbi:hypothetical protein QYE76_054073 [Lolium multiflorum]|uniref:Uncharacterized protein n=1 Tax=Lolium multiflorum TaxID=4521 RepID=A0AAD8SXK7_LOLMU|nr:hypothetical protein QYE76_054073 [Lolium multiflorum]